MNLPLLAFASALYPKVDLSNVTIVACQHVLGTTVDLFQALLAKGLKPEHCYVLGKCYSTHPGTFNVLRSMGIKVSDFSAAFDGARSFDEQFSEYVKRFADDARSDGAFDRGRKVIVLDDGGFLLRYVQDTTEDVNGVSGVEQTSSGFERLKSTNLRFGVVNVARSKAKLGIESPFIADRVIREIEKQTAIDAVTRVLVVGQGTIGRAIKELLKNRCVVSGCDADAKLCDFGGAYLEQLPTFDVIIGTTGKSILRNADLLKLKKSVVLVSASSSDREFPAVEMRVAAGVADDCHANIAVNGVRLLNGGFPVNFAGQENPTPPEKIQLTRALLLAGVCEASQSITPGFHDLSDTQDRIAEEFLSYSKSL